MKGKIVELGTFLQHAFRLQSRNPVSDIQNRRPCFASDVDGLSSKAKYWEAEVTITESASGNELVVSSAIESRLASASQFS